MQQLLVDALEWAANLNFPILGVVGAIILAITITGGCLYQKQFPDMGQGIGCAIALAGLFAGFKIVILSLHMTADQLNSLKDERMIIAIGGLATMGYTVEDVYRRWKRTCGIP